MHDRPQMRMETIHGPLNDLVGGWAINIAIEYTFLRECAMPGQDNPGFVVVFKVQEREFESAKRFESLDEAELYQVQFGRELQTLIEENQ